MRKRFVFKRKTEIFIVVNCKEEGIFELSKFIGLLKKKFYRKYNK